ncbi:CvpA family protein [Vandammella animalimorsus]|uniref:CvpA family protein n=1 Tax=Vandammella animalimorsus TaxID=2029117 RepID=A0A3M6RKW7_9BURK|nr:CvpA family protein [Vandammella animalimorsus]RMX15194.1 CvpA family protein [Vandammella animalimorsus]
MTLNGFDLVFLMLAFVSVAVGIWRGFVFESLAVLGWGLGALAAMRLGPELGQWLPGQSLGAPARRVLGMLALFIAAVFGSSILATMARRSIKALGMRAADRFVGALFGALRIALVGVVLAVAVHALRWQTQPWWSGSAVGPALDAARLELARLLPDWTILQAPEPLELPAVPMLPAGAAMEALGRRQGSAAGGRP